MDKEIIIQLALATLFGGIIGFEREYRSKAAGFRTITLITLGSTLFTIISYKLGAPTSPDRIASNIVTGIGFIGAGVIFKDKFSVSGLTTASSIWVAAAIGMAVGGHHYITALLTLVLAIIVLWLFEWVQDWIDSFHQVKAYRIVFNQKHYREDKDTLETYLKQQQLGHRVKRSLRSQDEVIFFYEVSGNEKQLIAFNEFMITNSQIRAFDE